MPETPGIVYLVGAGPGDPGLLTRRGYEVLRCADVVVYDQLANDRLLDLAPASAERIFAGKIQGKLTITQGDMNRLLAERAGRGLKVVRLKGGDPYVFGRGAEEAEHLHLAGIPFLVIPGVTAGVGVTAYAGIPVTHRDIASAVAFVTGHDDPEATTSDRARLNWSALAAFPGTLVIYMGVTRLASICRTLVREGKPETTPAAMVQSGTLARQRTVTGTLATLADRVTTAGLGPPALLVVGEVIDRRPGLNWFEERPLFGRRIVVTRPEDDSDRSASILEDLGAEVLTAPTVAIRPVVDTSELDAAIARLDEFDWLVFTSSNGVKHLLDRIDALGLDLRALGSIRLAAIGPATAETLATYRLRADLVPPSYRSEALADALIDVASGQRILLARADRGRTILKEELSRVAEVEQVAVYRNVDAERLPDEVARRIEDGSIDWITLTSSAIAERLHALVSESARAQIGHSIKLATISPVTSATVAKLGWPVAAEAMDFTWDGLVAAIVRAESRATSP
jgi:uroporphyrinogen III methyltransferase/synthase